MSEPREKDRKAAWAVTRERCDWPHDACKPGKSLCGPCGLVDLIVARMASAREEGRQEEMEAIVAWLQDEPESRLRQHHATLVHEISRGDHRGPK